MSGVRAPVALFIFNRPEPTARVLQAIAAARPATLLVVADGPRASRPGEQALCEQARDVIARVDWPCDVRLEYSDRNLGCRRRVSSGLDWVFSQVDRAIILEDDCLPDPSFFPYCDDLLERYADNPRVAHIAGPAFLPSGPWLPHSYYFSLHITIWGWATWRRAWQHYDQTMAEWPRLRERGWLDTLFEDPAARTYWRGIFDTIYGGSIDTWDYQWVFACWRQGGLSTVPRSNLISNIGFGDGATHTRDGLLDARAALPTQPLTCPLRHPPVVVRHRQADQRLQQALAREFPVERLQSLALAYR